MKSSAGSRQRQGRITFREISRKILEQEKGAFLVKSGAPLKVALYYPNHYSVGMASLGFQTVYRLFNAHPDVVCERAFIWEPPFDRDIRTLESGRPLRDFDIIGVSLSFELDILSLIRSLLESGIPPLKRDRSEKDPLLFGGGAVLSLNPSPLLEFMDGLLVGEVEGSLYTFCNTLLDNPSRNYTRRERVEALSTIPGVFIPDITSRVQRQYICNLDEFETYTPIVTPKSHFKDMFVIEVARGCPRGCYFCAAQKIYAPYRIRSVDNLVETVNQFNPGAFRIGLESAGLSDYPHLDELCDKLIHKDFRISFSSIRPDRVTAELIYRLEKGGVKSFTIAPETGSEELRFGIRKKIWDDKLIEAASLLGASSIQTLKLYFLIGLPGETKEDIEGIIDLTHRITDAFIRKNKGKQVRFSVNAFIPKPHTEFQWASMNTEKELNQKRKIIRKSFQKQKNIVLVQKSVREEILQGALSLGDQRIGVVLLDHLKTGLPWKQIFQSYGLDLTQLLFHERTLSSVLPWDFIETDLSKNSLWKRYKSYRT